MMYLNGCLLFSYYPLVGLLTLEGKAPTSKDEEPVSLQDTNFCSRPIRPHIHQITVIEALNEYMGRSITAGCVMLASSLHQQLLDPPVGHTRLIFGGKARCHWHQFLQDSLKAEVLEHTMTLLHKQDGNDKT